jgi:hypothetical protein
MSMSRCMHQIDAVGCDLTLWPVSSLDIVIVLDGLFRKHRSFQCMVNVK